FLLLLLLLLSLLVIILLLPLLFRSNRASSHTEFAVRITTSRAPSILSMWSLSFSSSSPPPSLVSPPSLPSPPSPPSPSPSPSLTRCLSQAPFFTTCLWLQAPRPLRSSSPAPLHFFPSLLLLLPLFSFSLPSLPQMYFSINAATKIAFTGDRFLHGWI